MIYVINICVQASLMQALVLEDKMKEIKNLYEKCKEVILAELHQEMDPSIELSDHDVQKMIDELIFEYNCEYVLTLEERNVLSREIFNEIRKLDILQELIEDEQVTEIMVNGTESIFIEKAGCLQLWDKKFQQREQLEHIIQKIVAKCNRAVNEASPIVDARLENGSRVNVVLPPVALNGPIVTIRRFPDNPITMDRLIELGSITQQAAEFLNMLVICGYNIFVSGGTGSGKTTFLNALSHAIPNTERIITIEDSAELQLQEIPNLVRLETRNISLEGTREISIRDLIKASLRMRPDRIIVGEVRGAEALDMLQVMNTGHDGSLSTGHANSSKDMLSRIETMVLMGNVEMPLEAVRRQIASGLDILIHLGRLRDKSRKVLEIVEIVGYEDGEIVTNPLFQFQEQPGEDEKMVQGNLVKINNLLMREKMLAHGYIVNM